MQEENRSAGNDIEGYIEEIRILPDLLETAVNGLDDTQLNTPYRDGGWTIRQVAHHIADSHINGFIRMRATLTEENPMLKTYDQDRWAEQSDSELPLAPSLSIIRGLHERWTVFLHSLSNDAWDRPALHPDDGPVSLRSLLANYARHGRHHVHQILGLRKGRSW